ncbi:MAG: radical SAM protein [Magnetococcales bacterium]|nr:radical SAM protein [Magnetococcales bacterium]MBF0148662.1 radical SAM protein [Magnetococcales bacterium]MBF0174093.1 radical SAM protein [Magnetococcales bacterium]MBF0346841.1 radical SAM protein [Magnetococcales bacterium]MBF0631468.1 radical SAM protein [Magnetococcales bacterium]
MRYEGPVYRPPSEADSLLIQATVGCPHNHCTFCMVYKSGPRYRVRPVEEICEDLVTARRFHGTDVRTLFLPAGNTIAMDTDALVTVCQAAREQFPHLERITVYGSSSYILDKGVANLIRLRQAGLNRIHVGLETGDDETLLRVKKGSTAAEQILAGQWVKESGMELSLYVVLGLAGAERSLPHAEATAQALNAINPDFIRIRTFVPKKKTPMLRDWQQGRFTMLGPHGILEEMHRLVELLQVNSFFTCDHYTNYLPLQGRLPEARKSILAAIEEGFQRPESSYRPFFIGSE